jgi:6-phosphogluconolactonase (cycloisomerase 2 family)
MAAREVSMRWLNVSKAAVLLSVILLAFSAAGENATQKYPRYVFALVPGGDTAVYGVNSGTGTLRLTRVVPGPGGISAVTHPNGRFIYSGGYGVIKGFSVQADGSLLSLPGSPYNVPGASNLTSIGLSPSGKTLAVADFEFNDVWSYVVDTVTGALTLAPGAPFTAGPGGLTIDHSSKFLYVSGASNNVYAFSINPANAVLTAVPGSPFSLSAGNMYPGGMIGDLSGKYLYVSGSKGVDGFSVNSQTGALQLIVGSPFAGPGAQGGVLAADPLGKFIYAGRGYGVYVYTVDGATGALKGVAGSPFGIWAGYIAPDPTGSYLFTTRSGPNVVGVNRTTGALTLINAYSDIATEGPYLTIAVSTGAAPVKYTPKFAYVANQGDNTVTGYRINATSGALSKVGSATVGTYPTFLTADLNGRFLFVTNCGSSNLSVFKINASNGIIAEVPGSPYTTGGCPVSAAVDAFANYVYVGSSDYTVSTFSIDPGIGTLTNVGSTSFQAHCGAPGAMVIAPMGTNLYAACGNLAVVAILTPTPVPDGGGNFVYSTSLVADPHGGWGWGVVSGKAVEQIGFDVYNVGFWAYGPSGGSPTGGVAVDPFGRFLYAVEGNANDIQASSIALGGPLTLIPGSPFAAGTSPVAGASDFSGKFLYIVNQGSNDLSGYAVDQLTGALTPLTPATVGTGKAPISIVTTGTTH